VQAILAAVRSSSEHDAGGGQDDERRVLLHGNTLLDGYIEHAVTSSKAQPSRAQNVQRSLAPMLAKMLKTAASEAMADTETKAARDAQLRQALHNDAPLTPTLQLLHTECSKANNAATDADTDPDGAAESADGVPKGLLARAHESAIRARVVVEYRASQQKGQQERKSERQAVQQEEGASEDESGADQEGMDNASSELNDPNGNKESAPVKEMDAGGVGKEHANKASAGNVATSGTPDDKPHCTASIDIAVRTLHSFFCCPVSNLITVYRAAGAAASEMGHTVFPRFNSIRTPGAGTVRQRRGDSEQGQREGSTIRDVQGCSNGCFNGCCNGRCN
jgi:hypothetical protein